MATPNSGEGNVRHDDALTKEMKQKLKIVGLESGIMILKSCDSIEELLWKLDDYFMLLNTTYRKLSSMDGRNHAKSVSIIQAVSACQICVRMFDFELHNTILEIFHLFLDGIQLNHPQEIFSSMEDIMTLIIQYIEESDEFVVELTKIFLVALKKENKNISPCAFQRMRKVFEKCADSMHNSVPEAVRHMGDAVQEYDDVIVSSSDNMSCYHKKATPNSGEGDVRWDDALTKEMEEELKRVVLEYGNMNLKSGDPVEELQWKSDNISPCAFQLARKVFEKRAYNIHDFVSEAIRHMGDAVQEYDDVNVSSFLGATQSDNVVCLLVIL
ncbi:sister chromatid cohesion protein PDS5 homolog E-like isoform X2 [Primulina tabacum]|uniref:sister chromatid cohesion protein PDS5 homolog E-like isoform X2 n=2 Tax=Primulina tabacum TaxID=48773 RepID=UPI003F5AC105